MEIKYTDLSIDTIVLTYFIPESEKSFLDPYQKFTAVMDLQTKDLVKQYKSIYHVPSADDKFLVQIKPFYEKTMKQHRVYMESYYDEDGIHYRESTEDKAEFMHIDDYEKRETIGYKLHCQFNLNKMYEELKYFNLPYFNGYNCKNYSDKEKLKLCKPYILHVIETNFTSEIFKFKSYISRVDYGVNLDFGVPRLKNIVQSVSQGENKNLVHYQNNSIYSASKTRTFKVYNKLTEFNYLRTKGSKFSSDQAPSSTIFRYEMEFRSQKLLKTKKRLRDYLLNDVPFERVFVSQRKLKQEASKLFNHYFKNYDVETEKQILKLSRTAKILPSLIKKYGYKEARRQFLDDYEYSEPTFYRVLKEMREKGIEPKFLISEDEEEKKTEKKK